jgi:hypothetical protein
MKTSIETTSSVTSSDGKKYATLTAFLAARRVLGANRTTYKDSNQSLSAGINSAYSLTGNLLDEIVAKAIGASSVVGTKGHGVIFDNIVINNDGTIEISENKLVSSVTSAEGIVEKVSQISIAGGDGINLSPGTKTLFTGNTFNASNITLAAGEISEKVDLSEALGKVEVSFSKYFISNLIKNRKNQTALKKLIGSDRSEAAIALRRNFELKSSDIRVVLNINGRAVVRSIGWSWKDIQNNPKAKISVIPDGKGGIEFNIYFTEALVKDALNKTETILRQKELEISNDIAKSLADQFAAFSPAVLKFLDSYSVNLSRTYDVGSLLVAKGKIKDTSKITRAKAAVNKPTPQKFISSAQWTVLVQKRLGDSMLSFGEPEPPDIKERSGRFRRSVEVTANYRTKTIQYTYNPLYRSLEHYGYHPELQVERSIRQVAQALYAREFSILRRGSLA